MNFIRIAFVALLATVTLASCDDDTEYVYYNPKMPNALVTVKHNSEGQFYLQLDNGTTAGVTNMTKSPYGDKEVRALVNCYEVKRENAETAEYIFSKDVFVNWIDSIRTKDAVPYPAENADELYGNDPVELVKDWVTVAEDGYLTLRIRTQWGGKGNIHYVNLLTGGNDDNAYEVEFRHDAKGDTKGHWGDALVAFKLPESIMANGNTGTLTLKYKSYSGEKTVQFDMETGKGTLVNTETERAAYSSKVQ